MITEHILSELSIWLRIDKARVEAVIDNVKRNGYLQAQDVRELANVGLPIVTVISGVLRISNQQTFELLRYDNDKRTGNITYQDLIMILGIIAQDWKFREQLAKTRRNG